MAHLVSSHLQAKHVTPTCKIRTQGTIFCSPWCKHKCYVLSNVHKPFSCQSAFRDVNACFQVGDTCVCWGKMIHFRALWVVFRGPKHKPRAQHDVKQPVHQNVYTTSLIGIAISTHNAECVVQCFMFLPAGKWRHFIVSLSTFEVHSLKCVAHWFVQFLCKTILVMKIMCAFFET